jgi:hypothetical protein
MFEKKQTGEAPKDDKDKTSLPEMKEASEERKHGGRHKRAHGGALEERREEKDEEASEHAERKRGGRAPHHARKHGGHVPGHKGHHRPDKRARGGGADMHPESSAGNMSSLDYERGKRSNKDEEGAGRGADRNAKGFG